MLILDRLLDEKVVFFERLGVYLIKKTVTILSNCY
jgi:hypothetical protein